MSRSWRGGSTTAWRKLRAAVLARDGYRCRAHADGWCAMAPGEHECAVWAPLSGVPGGPSAGQAHHTLGREVTGDDPAHIVAACGPCNRHIGDPGRHAPRPRRVSRW